MSTNEGRSVKEIDTFYRVFKKLNKDAKNKDAKTFRRVFDEEYVYDNWKLKKKIHTIIFFRVTEANFFLFSFHLITGIAPTNFPGFFVNSIFWYNQK